MNFSGADQGKGKEKAANLKRAMGSMGLAMQDTVWFLHGVLLLQQEERIWPWWLEFKLAFLNGESRTRSPGGSRPVINLSGHPGSILQQLLYREREKGERRTSPLFLPKRGCVWWHYSGTLEKSQRRHMGTKNTTAANQTCKQVLPSC